MGNLDVVWDRKSRIKPCARHSPRSFLLPKADNQNILFGTMAKGEGRIFRSDTTPHSVHLKRVQIDGIHYCCILQGVNTGAGLQRRDSNFGNSDAKSRSRWRYWLPEQRKATPANHSPKLHPEHAFVFRTSHAKLSQLSKTTVPLKILPRKDLTISEFKSLHCFLTPSSALPPTLIAMNSLIADALGKFCNSALE